MHYKLTVTSKLEAGCYFQPRTFKKKESNQYLHFPHSPNTSNFLLKDELLAFASKTVTVFLEMTDSIR